MNNPRDEIKRYVHQPLTIDHYGIRAMIKENGHVIITTNVNGEEYDEVEIPASLVFKLANALKMTRSVEQVQVVKKEV